MLGVYRTLLGTESVAISHFWSFGRVEIFILAYTFLGWPGLTKCIYKNVIYFDVFVVYGAELVCLK
jgi:hypothetical protein